ncbi:MAG TPA: ABC transporter ATP-binding protein [Solirubrobacteraceae bacterium]|nr:ABC transporter ATP-binding protein [Solirubrobacteraceae bacterium]
MKTTNTQTDGLAIEVRDLRKSYGEIEAVRGVSFEVMRGEVFCLLGPNGAGKTTTVEILEGYRERTAGEARVLGMDPLRGQRELRDRVGIVLQQSGVQTDLTVAELIEMYSRYYSRRRPVDELIELVELGSKRDVRARELSGGQRRRLDLALGLVGDPDLLFLDEPTTGFDPGARRHAWSTIRSLCDLGKTVFLTTHYMDEAQHLADRVAVMNAGQIIAMGRPEELGGRDLRPAEIRFTLDADWSLGDLPDIPCETRSLEGDRVVVLTKEPVVAAQRITTWALEHEVDLGHFSVSQPTLEDIYLELTGSGEENDQIAEEVVR